MKKLILLVVVVALAFVAWPYFALYQTGNALNAADAAALEDRADWPALRASVEEEMAAAIVAQAEKGEGPAGDLGLSLARDMAPEIAKRFAAEVITAEGLAALVRRSKSGETAPAPEPAPATDGVVAETDGGGAIGLLQGIAQESGVDLGEVARATAGQIADRAGVGAEVRQAMSPSGLLPNLPRAVVEEPLSAVEWAFFTGPTTFEITIAHEALGSGQARLQMALQGVAWKIVGIKLPAAWLDGSAG